MNKLSSNIIKTSITLFLSIISIFVGWVIAVNLAVPYAFSRSGYHTRLEEVILLFLYIFPPLLALVGSIVLAKSINKRVK